MPPYTMPKPIVLTIAGSDSGGGAGIQADIKTISATGSYACSVITAVTSQNTLGVQDIHSIPAANIESQLDSVFQDLNVVAVKIGMLASSDIIYIVAKKLRQYRPKYVVVDPVLISTSGSRLLNSDALVELKKQLIPMADLLTPNLYEGAILASRSCPKNEHEMKEMIEPMRALGAKSILLKGGHLQESQYSSDLLIQPNSNEFLTSKRHQTKNTHGTGCTLSAAIASYLAQGNCIHKSVFLGKQYISQAIACADLLEVGSGYGPVEHFFYGHENVR